MATSAAVTRRQMIEEARALALAGNWEAAIPVNQRLLERTPKDAEAHNRLGRAQLALGRYAEAIEAYSEALRADPANLIARRNLQRLDTLRHRDSPPVAADAGGIGETGGSPRTTVFIEEVGKTWVDELVNPAGTDVLVDIYPAEQLQLLVEGNRLIVTTDEGRRLGEVEAKTAERMIELMQGGNRYDVYSLGLSAQSLRVILREVFHDPSLADMVSFPRQITSRAYLRERDLLRLRDESDFFFSDDDEDDDDTASAESDDEEAAESDNDQFMEETVSRSDEEESGI